MKIILILLFLLLLPTETMAADKWNKQDITLEAISTTLMIIDWGQTRYIAKNPNTYYERYNPILRGHPSTKEVDMYFLSAMILRPVITHFLPEKWRPYWQSFTIGISGACISNNLSIGIGVRW